MNDHFAWDYEEPYDKDEMGNFYHIYAHSDEAEDIMRDAYIYFYVPNTERNTEIVKKIHALLNELAEENK